MIPKIIHYCWFGGAPLPEFAHKCIASWRKYFPDYEIKEWNETNYEVHKITYTDEAYRAKKYVLVNDYARIDILYRYGGIYFDLDVEVIKSFDMILTNGDGFIGLEKPGYVNPGLGMGCRQGAKMFGKIMEHIARIPFVYPVETSQYMVIINAVAEIFNTCGLKEEDIIQNINGIIVYPVEYFSPKSFTTGKLEITQNTYSIHHFKGTWLPEKKLQSIKTRWKIISVFGDNRFSYRIVQFINRGFVASCKAFWQKLIKK
ncbi:hypothetical protein A9P82_07060 [Arachidicoccus ginsenosidimutans]|uniref:glycosyltransferase family 32 protein n=1 Tax=Arachidicoccus sp. BS20 TaxID=1850526 RepID=UPI0007F11B95|nr:glycosyltransferase [Arachidicoccus sp. BS20]ANI89068.1 hypothetical protein A9P82_07060 [Arachidicoccus sp. BS20]